MIRPYLQNDKAFCLNIFKDNCPKYFGLNEFDDFNFWLDLEFNSLSEDKSNIKKYFVLELNDQVIGCGGYVVNHELKLANMAWGMVDPKFHKQGYGKMLYEFRLNDIRTSFPDANVALDTSQHTYTFFERLGFKVEKITPDGYAPGLDKYDMVLQND